MRVGVEEGLLPFSTSPFPFPTSPFSTICTLSNPLLGCVGGASGEGYGSISRGIPVVEVGDIGVEIVFPFSGIQCGRRSWMGQGYLEVDILIVRRILIPTFVLTPTRASISIATHSHELPVVSDAFHRLRAANGGLSHSRELVNPIAGQRAQARGFLGVLMLHTLTPLPLSAPAPAV